MRKFFSVILILATLFVLHSHFVFAGALDGVNSPVSFPSLGVIITNALPIVFGLVALLAVVIFSIGAVRYLVSRGDVKAAEGARNTMTGAVIGLVIVLGAASLSGVLEATLGSGLFGTAGSGGPLGINGEVFLRQAFRLTTGAYIGAKFPDFGSLVTFILLLIITVGALLFFFMLIYGGIRYMLARGDDKAVTDARATLTNAFFGLLLMISALVIIRLIAQFIFRAGYLVSP